MPQREQLRVTRPHSRQATCEAQRTPKDTGETVLPGILCWIVAALGDFARAPSCSQKEHAEDSVGTKEARMTALPQRRAEEQSNANGLIPTWETGWPSEAR